MFRDTGAFGSVNGDITSWDTSNVEDMSWMFSTSIFNKDIGSWNTSGVTNMERMFYGASLFNQNLSGWCVTNILSKPTNFDYGSAFEGVTSVQPDWGNCP